MIYRAGSNKVRHASLRSEMNVSATEVVKKT